MPRTFFQDVIVNKSGGRDTGILKVEQRVFAQA